ncbi:hypothetical protein AZE42_03945 [Rhizopogon vesiculosus]|uniref:Uncharacterized protein n=1 Tax=Rhizopogon vesiculosus TaxID=180088 RepID=A0A1J8QF13_9AGAM|nr:hypothetical protein AZE42_03945 [Rhizopogon vesiculosus]
MTKLLYRDPIKTFTIATFPDGEKIATGSFDRTIRIWRVENGTELKNPEGPKPDVHHLLFQYHQWQLWVRDAETEKIIAGPLGSYTHMVMTIDISPDSGVLASGSLDRTVILWDTTTWKLGVAMDKDIQIRDLDRRERLSNINDTLYLSLAWARDGAHLLSASIKDVPVIHSWGTST